MDGISWLDTVPIARVVSRCTADIEAMDEALPLYMDLLLKIFISLVVSLVAVVFVAGWRALLLGAFIAIAGAGWGSIYLRAQLCVKRENSNAKSPGTFPLPSVMLEFSLTRQDALQYCLIFMLRWEGPVSVESLQWPTDPEDYI